jgi:hypothetical protein
VLRAADLDGDPRGLDLAPRPAPLLAVLHGLLQRLLGLLQPQRASESASRPSWNSAATKGVISLKPGGALTKDDQQEPTVPVLLVDEGRCGASTDRVLAHGSLIVHSGVCPELEVLIG